MSLPFPLNPSPLFFVILSSVCNILVGTGILKGLWFAVNEIHKVSIWKELGYQFSLAFLISWERKFQ